MMRRYKVTAAGKKKIKKIKNEVMMVPVPTQGDCQIEVNFFQLFVKVRDKDLGKYLENK